MKCLLIFITIFTYAQDRIFIQNLPDLPLSMVLYNSLEKDIMKPPGYHKLLLNKRFSRILKNVWDYYLNLRNIKTFGVRQNLNVSSLSVLEECAKPTQNAYHLMHKTPFKEDLNFSLPRVESVEFSQSYLINTSSLFNHIETMTNLKEISFNNISLVKLLSRKLKEIKTHAKIHIHFSPTISLEEVKINFSFYNGEIVFHNVKRGKKIKTITRKK